MVAETAMCLPLGLQNGCSKLPPRVIVRMFDPSASASQTSNAPVPRLAENASVAPSAAVRIRRDAAIVVACALVDLPGPIAVAIDCPDLGSARAFGRKQQRLAVRHERRPIIAPTGLGQPPQRSAYLAARPCRAYRRTRCECEQWRGDRRGEKAPAVHGFLLSFALAARAVLIVVPSLVGLTVPGVSAEW